jgi:hypothetical protein
VEALLGKRAAINAQDCELRTPVMRAIASGRKEIVRRLLDQERRVVLIPLFYTTLVHPSSTQPSLAHYLAHILSLYVRPLTHSRSLISMLPTVRFTVSLFSRSALTTLYPRRAPPHARQHPLTPIHSRVLCVRTLVRPCLVVSGTMGHVLTSQSSQTREMVL